ncbi:MAG: zinc dependent phospholipase C family protein [Candidatus Pacearchaeota archaeon]
MNTLGHKKVGYFIINSFQIFLNDKEKQALLKGCIMPDKWKKKRLKYPHHRKKRIRDIMEWIIEARKDFLKGNLKESAYKLGIALHFVGDYGIASPRGNYRKLKEHQVYERKMQKIEDRIIPLFTLNTPLEIPAIIENFLTGPLRAAERMRRIYQVSFAISEIVWRNPNLLSPREKDLLNNLPEFKKKFFLISGIEVGLFILGISFMVLKEAILFSFLCFLCILILNVFSQRIPNPFFIKKWYGK